MNGIGGNKESKHVMNNVFKMELDPMLHYVVHFFFLCHLHLCPDSHVILLVIVYTLKDGLWWFREMMEFPHVIEAVLILIETADHIASIDESQERYEKLYCAMEDFYVLIFQPAPYSSDE